MDITDKQVSRRALLSVPRSRGAVSGLLILVLGVWGALIPFVGPTFNYAFSPDNSWTWTAARGWLEVLPGAVAVVGGLLLLTSGNRITASLGAWLAVAAGAWFVIGRDCADFFHMGSPGAPTGSSNTTRLLEALGFFSGVGGLLIFLASVALGRLSVRSARDLHAAERALQKQERHEAEIREQALAQARAEQYNAVQDNAGHDNSDQVRADAGEVRRPNADETAVLERDNAASANAESTERVVAPATQSVRGEQVRAATDLDERGASRLGNR